jgi:hypothetical protein
MALADRLRKTITIAVERHADSASVKARVGERARERVGELIRAGVGSPAYTLFVDHRAGGPEETVKLDRGNITYLFARLSEAVSFALADARRRSPVESGRYRDSWFIVVNGQPWTAGIKDIPFGSQVMITNAEPYHRKIDTGGMRMRVPPGIVEAVRQDVQKQFPGLEANRTFISIPSGTDSRGDPVPYVLKTHGRESGLGFDAKKEGGFFRRHPPRASRRADRRAGETMTYPALVIAERII